MASFLKKLVLVAAVARLAVASAFVFSGGSRSTAYRPTAPLLVLPPPPSSMSSMVPPLASTSTSTARIDMSTAAPSAPVKEREKRADVDVVVVNEDENGDRGWLVRLYNDPMNKREFVARCLNDICGLGDGAAYDVMMKAHQTGIAVIGNYHRELAELYKARLSGEGLLIDMVPADDD
ncbi:hypothetical protein ACHAXA_000435 [Cyclostephanos tholiformis]|uniref:Adaptor protein ClpS core domain-containing protein n=1 Tax=Cyclostephanos tholiformis TaxID=382380 RepID=A0ABD3RVX4_9STRA